MKSILARFVRLVDSSYKNAHGVVGRDIDSTQVSRLVVFPELQQARWDIGTASYMGVYSTFRAADSADLDEFENGSEHKCETCGDSFATAQALGMHRTKHAAIVQQQKSVHERGKR